MVSPLDSDDASTHALATLLLVALAVAGSMVVGVAAFDLEERVLGEQRPQVDLGFEYRNDTNDLVVTHRSGDSFDGERVTFENESGHVVGDWSTGGTVSAGEAVVVEDVPREASVRVVWHDRDGGRVALARWTGPAGNETGNTSSIFYWVAE